ncbi:hypothetical protein VPH35_039204 [Triticum aestivum]|uniref:Uncharacterized protein n=1 Tax=Aegilops tauschii subsp. strangulata TaxID=200361 RepID=A0A453CQ02_AEGTS
MNALIIHIHIKPKVQASKRREWIHRSPSRREASQASFHPTITPKNTTISLADTVTHTHKHTSRTKGSSQPAERDLHRKGKNHEKGQGKEEGAPKHKLSPEGTKPYQSAV